MGDPIFSDDDLMAYADGELPEARASQLDLALAGDAVLARRLAVFTETRSQVSAAFEPMLDEPVPDDLVRHVRDLAAKAETAAAPEKIVPLRPKASHPAADRRAFWKLPLAAAIALAAGLGAGVFIGGDSQPPGGLPVAALSDPEISGALASLPSGESRVLGNGSRIALIATYRDATSALCREFEYDQAGGSTVVSVACSGEAGWEVMLAVAAAPADDTGYAPASSLETLDAYLIATGAQAPMSPDDEARALATLP